MSFRDGLLVVRKFWWLILVGLVAGVAVGYQTFTAQPATYTASSNVIVGWYGADRVTHYSNTWAAQVLAMGLDEEDYRAAAEAGGLDLELVDLEQAIRISQTPDEARIEAFVDANEPAAARAAVAAVITAVTDNVKELAGAGGRGAVYVPGPVTAELTSAPGPSLASQMATGGILGCALGFVLVGVAYFARRTVLSSDTMREFGLPVFGTLASSRPRASRIPVPEESRVLEKIRLALRADSVRFLLMMCSSAADVAAIAESGAASRLAAVMGPDAVIVAGKGKVGEEIVQSLDELPLVPWLEQRVLLTPELMASGRAARQLLAHSATRPVLFVCDAEPIALSAASLTQSVLLAAVPGKTRITSLRQLGVDLELTNSHPIGAVLVKA
ncbi:MAG: hypothetical protein LBC97_02265 [Bifidobacteriaceae bacterium]|jgi:hypothetical protein|nr:hypothetical protein [Bifidobacteriaceae bacterium]